jgi:LmbE family N-acetylglucosaminyl deacetylase
MMLRNPHADIFIPDGSDADVALARTTHLGIGAHQDDLEIAMLHGILECFGRADRRFTGITCTDGAGSAREGVYAAYTDDDMKAVRLQEQRAAAAVGRYSAMLQLGYASAAIKTRDPVPFIDELTALIEAAAPEVLYTHNPADKHATHIAVVSAVIKAVRRLPAAKRPRAVYGCEAWRGLDWLPDERKVVLDIASHEGLSSALWGLFDSQVCGGKRYDLAAQGRYRANATFLESHAVDTTDSAVYAMDLTPLVVDDGLDVAAYVAGLLKETESAVRKQLETYAG